MNSIVNRNLLEYLSTLDTKFFEFFISYKHKSSVVDKSLFHNFNYLYKTIKNKDPLQPFNILKSNGMLLNNIYDIFTLWSYYIIATKYPYTPNQDIFEYGRKIKKDYPLIFESSAVSLHGLSDYAKQLDQIIKAFSEYEIQFIVWDQLTDEEVVDKVFYLNRDIDILFLFNYLLIYFLPYLDIKLILKIHYDDHIKFLKKNKTTFLFSTLSIAVLSFIYKEPIFYDYPYYNMPKKLMVSSFIKEIFTTKFLQNFVNRLNELNSCVKDNNWLNKRIAIAGIFSSLGVNVACNIYEEFNAAMDSLIHSISEKKLNLKEFQIEYEQASTRAINIGVRASQAVESYTNALIDNNPISWEEAFKIHQKEYYEMG